MCPTTRNTRKEPNMADKPVLLTDAQMQQFIRDGYLILHPDFPEGFHEKVYKRIDDAFEKNSGRNPGNNLLPAVPELQDVWDHPIVHGAFSSILGPDYYLHLHRHVHESRPGSDARTMHKDSLHNSRFCADQNRRHHHCRWMMAMYYPQDTPREMGPTSVTPRSQYITARDQEGEHLFTAGPAGTVALIHYDILHKKEANYTDITRHMVKFLFTRMTEPTEPTWDHSDETWAASDDPQEPTWQAMWNWHLGKAPEHATNGASIETLSEQLANPDEAAALHASYTLGLQGEKSIPAMIDALSDTENENQPRNAGYGFTNVGEAAVPALLELTKNPDPKIRMRAVDVLGDLGLRARSATPDLIALLQDTDEDTRAHAAESLGTTSQNTTEAVRPLADILSTDESDFVRRNAALSLARLGIHAEDAIPELADAMRDGNHYVRGFAVHGLYRIGTPEALRAAMHRLQALRWDSEPRGQTQRRPKKVA